MRDAYATTWLSKNGGYAFGSARTHHLGEVGARLVPAIRRADGIVRQATLRFSTSSPCKRDVLSMAVLVRPEG